MAKMDLDWEKTEEFLISYIRDYMDNAGFENLVLGMSGGLDSSICAALACKAIGSEHVYGYSLPYAEQDTEDADSWANELGINFETINIEAPVDDLQYMLFNSTIDRSSSEYKLRKGNICARMRMIILYDQSKENNALVLGTGNKSEYWLGYTTMWGDMACSFTPIGGLFKTQERKLAEYMELPEKIIKKPPTAGLWNGQTDEDEMGFTYTQADAILSVLLPICTFEGQLIHDAKKHYKEKAFKAIKKYGFSSDVIEKVWKRVKTTEFKRRMPDSPCMTPKKLATNNLSVDDLFNREV